MIKWIGALYDEREDDAGELNEEVDDMSLSRLIEHEGAGDRDRPRGQWHRSPERRCKSEKRVK